RSAFTASIRTSGPRRTSPGNNSCLAALKKAGGGEEGDPSCVNFFSVVAVSFKKKALPFRRPRHNSMSGAASVIAGTTSAGMARVGIGAAIRGATALAGVAAGVGMAGIIAALAAIAAGSIMVSMAVDTAADSMAAADIMVEAMAAAMVATITRR